MNAQRILKIVGKTTEDKLVISGIYQYAESLGIPLDIILEFLRSKNVQPSWVHMYQEAVKNGMKHDRILTKFEPAIEEVYGSEYCHLVIQTLKEIYGK